MDIVVWAVALAVIIYSREFGALYEEKSIAKAIHEARIWVLRI